MLFVGANQINFAQPSEQNSEEQQVTSQGIINGDLNYSALTKFLYQKDLFQVPQIIQNLLKNLL